MSSERNTSGGSARKVWKPPQKKSAEDGGDASIPSLFAAASLMTKPKQSASYRERSGRTSTVTNTSSDDGRNTSSKAISTTTSTGRNSIKSNQATQRHIATPSKATATGASLAATTTTTTAKLSSTPTATRNSTKSISKVPEKYSVGVHAGALNSKGTGDLGGKIPSSKTTMAAAAAKNLSPRRYGPASPSKIVSPYSKTQRQSPKKKHWLEEEAEEEVERENVVSSPSTSQLPTSSNKSATSPIMSPEDQSKFVKENWHILKSLMKDEPAPTPIIDLEDSKKAMWKLKEAQWDNQSVSSEAERLEIEERARKGRQAADEEEIQAKIKDLYGTTDLDEVLISDKDDIGKYNLYSDSDDDSVE